MYCWAIVKHSEVKISQIWLVISTIFEVQSQAFAVTAIIKEKIADTNLVKLTIHYVRTNFGCLINLNELFNKINDK